MRPTGSVDRYKNPEMIRLCHLANTKNGLGELESSSVNLTRAAGEGLHKYYKISQTFARVCIKLRKQQEAGFISYIT